MLFRSVSTALRELRELLPKAEFTGVIADLATPEGAAELFAQAPDADILVNNAGTGRPRWRRNWCWNWLEAISSGLKLSDHAARSMI